MAMSNKKEELPTTVVKIGESVLKWVDKYKYLGIEIHLEGNFILSCNNLCVRGWKAAFKIKSALKRIDVNPDLTLKLFDALVKPIICYGSEIWGIMNDLFNSKSINQFWERLENLPVIYQLWVKLVDFPCLCML